MLCVDYKFSYFFRIFVRKNERILIQMIEMKWKEDERKCIKNK